MLIFFVFRIPYACEIILLNIFLYRLENKNHINSQEEKLSNIVVDIKDRGNQTELDLFFLKKIEPIVFRMLQEEKSDCMKNKIDK